MAKWVRGQAAGLDYGRVNLKLASLAPGNTILRVLFGIKGDGFWTNPGTAGQSSIKASESNNTAFGLVTTVGPGTETPPSPYTAPGDAAPPTQRWLYLAAASMSLTSFSGTSSTWTMGFISTWESNHTEAQVLATGFTTPNQLNLWLVTDTAFGAWFGGQPTDIAWYSFWWSVLTKV